mmetsp:Transcript_43540/g.85879  ORF Transcript_43540/g.85879 Transcript_43540/m.85879 type:complete len:86 (-) Transcript_43540:28-285(-)
MGPDGKFDKVQGRCTFGDTAESGKCHGSYNSNVDASTVRVFAQASVEIPGAFLEENDVPGAYYRGTPSQHGEDGYRSLFAPVLPG